MSPVGGVKEGAWSLSLVSWEGWGSILGKRCVFVLLKYQLL